MSETTFIGVDPGGSGAIAVLDRGEVHTITLKQTEADVAEFLRHIIAQSSQAHCFIEAVHSMPKQGVVSSFTFGRSYGFLRGLLIAYQVPFEEVTPQRWQKAMQCRTGGNKNASKARAQQLWPKMKITHAIADALLIAECCRRFGAAQ